MFLAIAPQGLNVLERKNTLRHMRLLVRWICRLLFLVALLRSSEGECREGSRHSIIFLCQHPVPKCRVIISTIPTIVAHAWINGQARVAADLFHQFHEAP
jgi:hypothetical protein